MDEVVQDAEVHAVHCARLCVHGVRGGFPAVQRQRDVIARKDCLGAVGQGQGPPLTLTHTTAPTAAAAEKPATKYLSCETD